MNGFVRLYQALFLALLRELETIVSFPLLSRRDERTISASERAWPEAQRSVNKYIPLQFPDRRRATIDGNEAGGGRKARGKVLPLATQMVRKKMRGFVFAL